MIMDAIISNFLAAGQAGLVLLGRAVLPVLFPFFVLTSLILQLVPVKRPWVVAGLAYLSGYPNGARLTKELYEQKIITTAEARHLAIITATPSPFFLIATVGTLFLGDTGLGVIIFLCAVVAALINGWLWRTQFTPHNKNQIVTTLPTKPTKFLSALNQALSTSTSAILNVCGVVLFFYLLAQLLHLPPFLAGILEMTTGVASTTNPFFIEFFVCFGGLSVAMQNLLFMHHWQSSMWHYFAYKLTHAILACGLFSIYWLLF